MAKVTGDQNKVMAEKVAKVREVVSNVSKNDIVLALHSNDLDVEKTIQAFCQSGFGALDEWVRPGGAAGKSKKNKNAKKTEVAPTAPLATSTAASKPASEKSPVATPIVPVVPLVAQAKKATPPLATNGVNGHSKEKTGLEEALKQSARHGTQWNKECRQGHDQIRQTFKSLRESLAEREKALLAELAHHEEQASNLFSANQTKIEALRKKSQPSPPVRRGRNRSGADISAELKEIKQSETNLLSSNVFSYDMRKLVDAISTFGRVANSPAGDFPASSPLTTASSIKQSASRTSIVSSVGDDSGLGQGSPIPPPSEKMTPVKNSAPPPVPTGTIQMASDGLSADQLAEIQRQVQERLAANGIDPSLMAAVSGGAEVVRRSRPARGGKAGSGEQRGVANKREEKQKMAKLSLFN